MSGSELGPWESPMSIYCANSEAFGRLFDIKPIDLLESACWKHNKFDHIRVPIEVWYPE